MIKNILSLSLLFLLIFLMQGCGVVGAGANKPAVMKTPLIVDGESLEYYGYENGDLSRVTHFVSKVDSNTNITMFVDGTNIYSKLKKLSADYSNYQYRFSFSYHYGTLLQSRDYWLQQAKINGDKGEVGITLDIDLTNLRAVTEDFTWDGENLKTMTSRMELKKGYSYWDINSFGLIGMRFFDPEKGGIAYIIASHAAKEPVPVSFRYYGNETVDVPAGTFKTRKYGFTIADPFLNGLLGKFAGEYFIWMDTSPRALMVKSITMEGITYKLAKIENIQ